LFDSECLHEKTVFLIAVLLVVKVAFAADVWR